MREYSPSKFLDKDLENIAITFQISLDPPYKITAFISFVTYQLFIQNQAEPH